MDAIKLLIADHEKVGKLFAEYEQLGDESTDKKTQIAQQICKELAVHATVEEELFYPAAREVLDDDEEEMIEEALKEHQGAKELVVEIKSLSAGVRMDVAVHDLKRAIEHHVEEEEGELFPTLEEKGMETTKLGEKMMARKQELLASM